MESEQHLLNLTSGQSANEVAKSIGDQIADGILRRIESFPQREARLQSQRGRMDSLPEDILWQGLGVEASPIFVVYKLIHEAFSNAPQFFRSALVEFLRAQPERFPAVFSREILWSVLTSRSGVDAPAVPSKAQIFEHLMIVQRRGIWWRSDDEICREADWVHQSLTKSPTKFRTGFDALRSMQLEKGTGITAGNLLLMVPGRLSAYADEVVALGRAGKLPRLEELHARISEFNRDSEADARHVSIPIDLLYTTTEDDRIHVRVLSRAKARKVEREELRRRSLYLRYFMGKAFKGYPAEALDLKMAFYLDSSPGFPWAGKDCQFHPQECMTREEFWNELCPGALPESLFMTIRETAAKRLAEKNIVKKLKMHFAAR